MNYKFCKHMPIVYFRHFCNIDITVKFALYDKIKTWVYAS